MIAPKTLTPAAVAALPDGELNELAAQIVMGWHREGGSWRASDGFIAHYYGSFIPASNEAHGFWLVDKLILLGCRFEMSYLRDVKRWYSEFDVVRDGEWSTLTTSVSQSRARAITEAAVLAAMAMKEGE